MKPFPLCVVFYFLNLFLYVYNFSSFFDIIYVCYVQGSGKHTGFYLFFPMGGGGGALPFSQ